MRNVAQDPEAYEQFYEELGQKYPETVHVHRNRDPGTRYWTVLSELAPYAKRGARLIDIGCNDGVYTIPYVLSGGTALGIDISQSLVDRANRKAETLGIRSRCGFIRENIEKGGIHDKADIVLLS